VWSAGCACGEEVYSLKILWEQMSRSDRHSAAPGHNGHRPAPDPSRKGRSSRLPLEQPEGGAGDHEGRPGLKRNPEEDASC